MKTLKTVGTRTALAGLLLGWTSLETAAAVLRVPAEYATIQAAVDAAASGDQIRIAAGSYTEQVMITSKDLRLVGEPGAVLEAFPGMTSASWTPPTDGPRRVLLGIVFCDHVTVRGLTVDGGRLADVNPGLLGVIFHGSGGSVENCTFKRFRGDPWLTQGLGLGAGNWASLNRGLQRLQVVNNTFEDNAVSVGMYAGNEPNSEPLQLRFRIDGNIIRGVGPMDTGVQTGIQLRPGTGGEVTHNLITGHNYTGSDLLFSFGIDANGLGATQTPIRYVENTFQDNQVHVLSLFAQGAQFVENTFEGPGAGAFNIGIASSGNEDRITHNRFSSLTSGVILVGDDPIFGTTLGIASDATLIGNRFCEVDTPILIEPLVTGVQEHGSRLNDCHEGPEQCDWN